MFLLKLETTRPDPFDSLEFLGALDRRSLEYKLFFVYIWTNLLLVCVVRVWWNIRVESMTCRGYQLELSLTQMTKKY